MKRKQKRQLVAQRRKANKQKTEARTLRRVTAVLAGERDLSKVGRIKGHRFIGTK